MKCCTYVQLRRLRVESNVLCLFLVTLSVKPVTLAIGFGRSNVLTWASSLLGSLTTSSSGDVIVAWQLSVEFGSKVLGF